LRSTINDTIQEVAPVTHLILFTYHVSSLRTIK
jgi:hypothetical protein